MRLVNSVGHQFGARYLYNLGAAIGQNVSYCANYLPARRASGIARCPLANAIATKAMIAIGDAKIGYLRVANWTKRFLGRRGRRHAAQ